MPLIDEPRSILCHFLSRSQPEVPALEFGLCVGFVDVPRVALHPGALERNIKTSARVRFRLSVRVLFVRSI